MADNLRQRLRHVYWIGGGPGGGKSTIARRLADRYRLHLYLTDDAMHDHADRSTAADAPYLEQFKAMNMDERWLTRSPETMLETFHWFRGEGFDLIVEDLLRLPAGTRVVAEGFRLLPHLVKPLLANPSHAVWLLPTPGFRQAALESRGSTWGIPHNTSDPERTRLNLIERDRMFTDRMTEETKRLGLPALRLSTGLSEEDLLNQVARTFGL
jgi:2-phosphoglycerate kinase